MWFDVLEDTDRHFLDLNLPYLNAAGTLGFYPESKQARLWGMLGAFITNPISYKPRKVAQNRIYLPFPGGFLLHSGHPNPGFKKVLQRYAEYWARAELPVIVHLLAEGKDTLAEMVQTLESCENVIGIELDFQPGLGVEEITQLIVAAQGELPLIISLNLQQSWRLADILHNIPIRMVRLAAPYGTLPDAAGNIINGRLYGPAVMPFALAEVRRLVGKNWRVIGGGGIYSRLDAEMLLQAGATAVAFDALLWFGGIELAELLGD